MNSDLFNDFCSQGSENKLELIDGKLIVGNTIVGSRLLLRQILQGWRAEAAVAIDSPISLWIEALLANLELNPAEIDREDLHTTLLNLKAIATTKEYFPEDLSGGLGKHNYDHNSLRQKLTIALSQIGKSLGGVVLERYIFLKMDWVLESYRFSLTYS
jgi:hypothetical protein